MLDRKECLLYSLKILFLCVLFSVLICLFCISFESRPKTYKETYADASRVNVIIDAGHGGRDGGAVSENGIKEKDLNLSVSATLDDILKLCGMETLMTRETDRLLCDENSPELKGKYKITDLKNRLSFAIANPDAVFISIHMNKFSVEKYSGLQVYYSSNNDSSFVIAKAVQDNICNILQPDNKRKVKKAGSNIYLLDRIVSPAILIECGFLSNTNEAEKLSDSKYQAQLSLIFADSVLSNLISDRKTL